MAIVAILSDSYSDRESSATGLADSAAFMRTVDCPDQFPPGYHVTSDMG